jgi:hypothetical protein
MYGLGELKERLVVTDSKVSCPCLGCGRYVERQRGVFRREEKYFCDEHGIFISPSTFEYRSESNNILWDYPLFLKHKVSKRENRIARDNSEDAVTWNVFRFLENRGLLLPFLSKQFGIPLLQAKTIYWSHDTETTRTPGNRRGMLAKSSREMLVEVPNPI